MIRNIDQPLFQGLGMEFSVNAPMPRPSSDPIQKEIDLLIMKGLLPEGTDYYKERPYFGVQMIVVERPSLESIVYSDEKTAIEKLRQCDFQE